MAVRLVLRIREDGRVTEDLVRSEEDFRGLIESSSDGIAIMDGDFRLLFTSPAARNLLGLDGAADDAEVSLLDLVDPADREPVRSTTLEHPAGDGPPLHFRVRQGDAAAPREVEATSTERPGSGRRVLYLRDVTKRRRRERELERMAYTDHLTALPNRAMLFQEMAAPSLEQRCLLVLDLDGFKAVNDAAGHEAGDQLLVEVARRLNTVVREDDLVARLGGDEFAVLVTGSIAEAEDVAQRVVDVLGMPHRTSEWAFAVGASVGVAELGAGGGQLAFREADEALLDGQAGRQGLRAPGATATRPPTSSSRTPTSPPSSTRACCSCGSTPPATPTGRIALVHAVPVWQHAVHGTVRGMELWSAAERQGRTAALQRWLLRQACARGRGPGRRPHRRRRQPARRAWSTPRAGRRGGGRARGQRPGPLAAGAVLHRGDAADLLGRPGARAGGGARAPASACCLDNYGMGHSIFALLARVPLDVVRVDLTALAPRDDTARALQVLGMIARTAREPRPDQHRRRRQHPRAARRTSSASGRRPAARPHRAARPDRRGARRAGRRRRPGPRRVTLPPRDFRRRKSRPPAGGPILAAWRAPTCTSSATRPSASSWPGRTVLTDPLLADTVGLLRRVVPLPDPRHLGRRRRRADQPPARRPPAPARRCAPSGRGVRIVVPRGAGAWLRGRGFPRVDELSAGETHRPTAR